MSIRLANGKQITSNGPALPITNNTIAISGYPLGGGTTLNATGRFTSSTASSSSFQISDSYCGDSADGTWTATKN